MKVGDSMCTAGHERCAPSKNMEFVLNCLRAFDFDLQEGSNFFPSTLSMPRDSSLPSAPEYCQRALALPPDRYLISEKLCIDVARNIFAILRA